MRANRVIQTPAQAQAFLSSLILDTPRPYPERGADAQRRVRETLQCLGNPHQGQRFIHIAGSKGKGSTALCAESIARAAGLRVGCFTSPHLQRWTERFRIDGCEIEESRFAELAERVRVPVDAIKALNPDTPPTFFDALTAMALLLFHESDVDVSILETGLGGRLDSTNVVRPAVACITALELEHTEKLGTTLAQIATEKAGIIKPGVPTVVGLVPPEALTVLEAYARRHGSELLRLGKEFQAQAVLNAGTTHLRLQVDTHQVTARMTVMGEHLATDAALAALCVRLLGTLDDDAWTSACEVGLERALLPGRIEIIQREPWIVVDSAHTQSSAAALAGVLRTMPAKERCFVVSFSGCKNLEAIGSRLFSPGCSVIVTEAETTRSMRASEVAGRLAANSAIAHLHIETDPVRACRDARARLDAGDLLCVTGSTYMAGLAREVL